MADAPASKESSWGAFEVILGLLLAVGLLSRIQGKPIVPPTEDNQSKETISLADDSSNRCGLSITEPISLQKVTGFVRLSGSVNGCNWKPDGNKLLFAQVINGAGVPVSDFVTVIGNGSNFLTEAFDTTIVINGNPKGTGYLMLIPATPVVEKAISVRIPLRFVQN